MILASGCSHAIDLCICVLAKHGQNILIPRPGFPLYKTLTSVYGVQYKQYNLLAEKNWFIDLEHLESLIDENTAAIVINNPSNPCGSVFSRKHLLQILELAERYRKPIIADEIYDKFVFSPKFYRTPTVKNPPNSRYSNLENRQCEEYERHNDENIGGSDEENNLPAEDSDGADDYSDYVDIGEDGTIDDSMESFDVRRTDECGGDDDDSMIDTEMAYVPFTALSSLSKTVPILTCGGISKTCLIPGLRLGWIIINDRQNIFDMSVRNGLNRLTQRLMGPNSLIQGALHDILTTVPETFYTQTMDFIYKNAKLCYERLRLVKGLKPHMPQGSMYLMVHFDPKSFPDIDGDLDFTSKLMNEESVLVLPGKCFDFPNYFRLCLTVPTNVMEEALDRMKEFCERHYIDNTSSGKYTSLVKTINYTTTTKTTAQNENPIMKFNATSTINGQQANKCK